MTDPMPWFPPAISLAAGALLGWAYFRGLRLTVDRLPTSRSPGSLALLSFAARALMAMTAFLLVAQTAHGPGLAAALLGFVAVRTVLVHRAGRDSPRGETSRGSR
jgi:F1F0 ATPase subunit 2